ncbi:hypothetical protein L226DRAFT_147466 [Lentinus tigrinus ALCF2SS1-7]|uniref:uncharacterized protein n=1 Tax=Lentinus tigrinus ALCF2SS1-7 TaxID=1328758 RepID=UPI001165F144|nr:hypothetical protein L226DRAFT_147466 [Lentinus tigrinus ALCF2SS1-7]
MPSTSATSSSVSSPWRTLDVVSSGTGVSGIDEHGNPIPSQLLGPILVGVLLNCFVYGIVFLHWIQYTLGRNRDSRHLKGLVHWCFFLDTVHSGAVLWMLWNYAVDNFANYDFLTTTLWPVSATPLFVALVSTPIQHLFAWRIKQFTHTWWIFGLLSGLSAASLGVGVVAAAEGLRRHDIQSSHRLIPLIDAWLGAGMVCDILLAVLLYSHLWRSKTGFRSTDTVIGRLMRSSVETTALSALFCILYLSTFSALPKTTFSVIFAMPLGRIYTGTLLSTLNSRSTLREELFGVSSINNDPLGDAFHISERMRRMPTEVAINVEQEIQMEQVEEVDFKQLRKSRALRKDSKPDSGELEFGAV